jgi:alpha-D-ribose 1-methylphosphonate 5-triphosphate synthase subunit PhnG
MRHGVMTTTNVDASGGGAIRARRSRLMELCAAASREELAAAVACLEPIGGVAILRAPETGLVMLRGRMGGTGAPFNVGEAPVTRMSVRLASGETGHAYRLGRDREAARLSAIIDAAGQSGVYAEALQSGFMEPVTRRVAAERRVTREQTEATRVNFFTLVRGEDGA